MTENQNKQVFHLIYPCFLCEVVFDGQQTILTHMNDTHGYYIPPRPPDVQRPLDEEFLFQQNPSNQERYACPACWFHCESGNMRELRLHTVHMHPYEGYDSGSEHTEENKNDIEPTDLETQKRELLDHILTELNNLNLFLKGFLS